MRGALTPLANCSSATARGTPRTCAAQQFAQLPLVLGGDFETQGWTGRALSIRQIISYLKFVLLEVLQTVKASGEGLLVNLKRDCGVGADPNQLGWSLANAGGRSPDGRHKTG